MNKKDAYVATYTGKMINPFYPNEDSICIEDIAHSLSLQCRFNGHLKRFYSVAEHCITTALVLRKLGYSPQLQLLGLLHDSSEAYLADIPAPVKECLVDYQDVEWILSSIIYSKLLPYDVNVSQDELDALINVDKDLALIEGRKLIGEAEWNKKIISFDVNYDKNRSFEDIEKSFIAFYHILLGEMWDEQRTDRTRNN